MSPDITGFGIDFQNDANHLLIGCYIHIRFQTRFNHDLLCRLSRSIDESRVIREFATSCIPSLYSRKRSTFLRKPVSCCSSYAVYYL
jgi:hypothetical protein